MFLLEPAMTDFVTPLFLLIAGALLNFSREGVSRAAGVMLVVAALPWITSTYYGRLTILSLILWLTVFALAFALCRVYRYVVPRKPSPSNQLSDQ